LFNLIGGIFLFNLPILVDYLWPLWDSKNQALHDKIVKSRVIRVTANVMVQPGSPSFPVGYPAEPTAPPTPTATPVPYVPPGQRYVAPQPPPAVHDPQQPVPPPSAAPPAQPTAPPPPPQPGGTSTPYTPPPGFDNPVPDEDDK
jgi:hypothetical protein